MPSPSDMTQPTVPVAKKPSLRGQLQQNVTAKQNAFCSMVFFTVGGQPLAARMEEVGSVRPWVAFSPVPSGQAYVNGLIRYGDDVFPVFDLAGSLQLTLQGTSHFCLMAKTPKGDLAIRIDSTIPSMQTIEMNAVHSNSNPQSPFREVCVVRDKEIPVYSFSSI